MELPCYVVSLKRELARREHTVRELGREGIRFEFVDAVDGKELRADERISRSLGVPIVSGDIACTMSHGLAMKTMLAHGHERALIVEDDVWLAPGFAQTIGKLLSAPVSWEFLKLAGFWAPSYTKCVEHHGYRFIWPEIASLSGQGYVITAAGANKFIPFTQPADDIFDLLVQQVWRTKIDLVEVLPRLVGGIDVASTIEHERQSAYTKPRTFAARWQRRASKLRRSFWKHLRR